ncbi:hypothetical protein OF897_05300 [Chryseobacterium formosus]|uniref:Por secretion system C-terminal sorting domain-containing protein n=1 Tax=Chryseobacterium formosus TaxID=1537363 RepID=A0ABT3XPS6_9FLAO|nr:hypothetical protein [Chryseobacterium formosus]MCX8523333.1 hypothetical protein [Chryseobacterium formosus]
MKKVFKSVLLIGFLSISATAMSKEKDFSLSFGKTEAETVNFEVSNAKNVSVVIYNDFYGELFSDTFEDYNSVSKSYNFKDLDSGVYYLVLESQQKIEKYKIKVYSDKKIEIEKEPVSEIFKPEFVVDGNKVKLLLSGVKTTAKISVTDFEDTIYYNATKSATNGEIELTFDFSKKTADQYIITVEENGKVFNKIISLR